MTLYDLITNYSESVSIISNDTIKKNTSYIIYVFCVFVHKDKPSVEFQNFITVESKAR